MNYLHQNLSKKIIKSFYDVYNELGFGFLEKVYQNSMYLDLREKGLFVETQKSIKVFFRKVEVGKYYADLIVNESIIIELKTAESIAEEHELQLVNYLKATEIEVGLLLNFGRKPQLKRKIFTNQD
jgi:GxxExxY protein